MSNIPIILGVNEKDQHPLNTGETLIPSSIPISQDGGNLLENRGNGLYYGMQAPPDIANLYISGHYGDDTNLGTKDTPLKTLDRLSDILNSRNPSGIVNVWLHAGEAFQGTKMLYVGNGALTLTFYYYNDPIFGDAYSIGQYNPWLDRRLNRPKIVYDTFYNKNTNTIQPSSFIGTTQLSLIYQGVDVDVNDSLGKGTSDGASFIYSLNSDFRGSVITLNSNTIGYGSSSSIILRQAIIKLNDLENHPDKKLFSSDRNPSLVYVNYGKDGDIHKDPAGIRPDVIGQGTNVKEVLKPQNIMAGAEYDANTKSQFGYTTSWDPFQEYKGV